MNELKKVDGVTVLMPAGTFYVFPNVQPICDRLGITSHGLAMYLLEGADDKRGVACLGGECFGDAGAGFLRFSCAEPDERLVEAVQFFADAITRTDRVKAYLAKVRSIVLASRERKRPEVGPANPPVAYAPGSPRPHIHETSSRTSPLRRTLQRDRLPR